MQEMLFHPSENNHPEQPDGDQQEDGKCPEHPPKHARTPHGLHPKARLAKDDREKIIK
jgi:hypothetical protein